VDDALHDVELRASRDFAEEVAADDGDTVRDSSIVQSLLCTGTHRRQIEQDAARIAAGA
jgi:hypothetical protein